MIAQRGGCGLIPASLTGYRISEKIRFSLAAVIDRRRCFVNLAGQPAAL
jgi:hypothetical protein